MLFVCTLLAAVLSCAPSVARAFQIFDAFPDEVRPAEHYVVYSHGLIVEGDDPRPVHRELGVYDFPAIKQALFEGGAFNLIAPHRPKNSDIITYVMTLETGVRRLVAAGVAPQRIALVGFSRVFRLQNTKIDDSATLIARLGTRVPRRLQSTLAPPLHCSPGEI